MSSPDLEREISDLRKEISDLKAVIALSAAIVADQIYTSNLHAGEGVRVSRREHYFRRLEGLVPELKEEGRGN